MSDFSRFNPSSPLQRPATVQQTDADPTTLNIPTMVGSDPTYDTYRNYPDGSTQGRTITASLARASAVTLAANVVANIVSISIPSQSSWCISAAINVVSASTTTTSEIFGGVSLVSATLPSTAVFGSPSSGGEVVWGWSAAAFMKTGGEWSMASPVYRFNNTTNSAITLYLITRSFFAVAGQTAYGWIQAVSIL